MKEKLPVSSIEPLFGPLCQLGSFVAFTCLGVSCDGGGDIGD